MAKYEYVAIELPKAVKRGERTDDAITDALNRVAEHGWRLAAVVPAVGALHAHAVMEREAR